MFLFLPGTYWQVLGRYGLFLQLVVTLEYLSISEKDFQHHFNLLTASDNRNVIVKKRMTSSKKMNVKKTNVIVKKDLIWQRSALASPARKTIVKDHILILILMLASIWRVHTHLTL